MWDNNTNLSDFIYICFSLLLLSGVCPQQGLVCQLFCLLYMQHQVDSQVSFVQAEETNSVSIAVNPPAEPWLSIRSRLFQVHLKDHPIYQNSVLHFSSVLHIYRHLLSFSLFPHESAPVSATLFFPHCRLSLFLFLSFLPPRPTPTSSVVFFPFLLCVSSSFSPPTLLPSSLCQG